MEHWGNRLVHLGFGQHSTVPNFNGHSEDHNVDKVWIGQTMPSRFQVEVRTPLGTGLYIGHLHSAWPILCVLDLKVMV